MFSRQLRAIVDDSLPTRRVDLFNAAVMLQFLIDSWQTIRASTDLLTMAIEETRLRQVQRDGNAFDGRLRAYLLAHRTEERGHGDWLRRDIQEALNLDVQTQPVSPLVKAMVGSVMYAIQYQHPVALLGYMAPLEWTPVSMDTLAALEAHYGPTLLHTVRYHAEHDPDHGAELARVIDAVPDDLQPIVLQTTWQTTRCLTWLAAQSNKLH